MTPSKGDAASEGGGGSAPDDTIRYRVLMIHEPEQELPDSAVHALQDQALEVCGVAVRDRKELIGAVQSFGPDLLLIPPHVAGLTSHGVVRSLAALDSDIAVVILNGPEHGRAEGRFPGRGAAAVASQKDAAGIHQTVWRVLMKQAERRRRQQAEREAEAHRRHLSHLFESAMDGILVLGARGEILEASPAAAQMLGYRQDELVGVLWAHLLDDEDDNPASLVDLSTEDKRVRRHFSARCRSGTRLDLDVTLTVEHEQDGSVTGYVIFRDVTRQLETERMLRREQELQNLLRQIAHDVDAPEQGESRLAESLGRIREFLDWPVAHLYTLDTEHNLMVSSETWAYQAELQLEEFMQSTRDTSFPAGDGLIGAVHEQGKALWLEDISAARDYRRRDSATGAGLVSAVAVPVFAHHQPAAVIELYSRQRRPEDESVTSSLQLIGHELGRLFERSWYASRLRRRNWELETLLENAPDIILRVSINETVTDVMKMLSRLIGENIELSADLTEEPTLVEADATKVEQVIVNLAVVYGIVEEVGGRIDVDTAPGRGTAFHIRIPAARGSDATAEPIAEPAASTATKGAHVLVVEDDTAIRDMVEAALTTAGYAVTAAGSLAEAESAAAEAEAVDIVLSDIVLPDGSGAELPDRLNAQVPFVFASGYLEDASELKVLRSRGHAFIRKSYDIPGVLESIRRALEGDTV